MTAKEIIRSIHALRDIGLSDTQIIDFILRIEGEEMQGPSTEEQKTK